VQGGYRAQHRLAPLRAEAHPPELLEGDHEIREVLHRPPDQHNAERETLARPVLAPLIQRRPDDERVRHALIQPQQLGPFGQRRLEQVPVGALDPQAARRARRLSTSAWCAFVRAHQLPEGVAEPAAQRVALEARQPERLDRLVDELVLGGDELIDLHEDRGGMINRIIAFTIGTLSSALRCSRVG
jgi:hypothetical protein